MPDDERHEQLRRDPLAGHVQGGKDEDDRSAEGQLEAEQEAPADRAEEPFAEEEGQPDRQEQAGEEEQAEGDPCQDPDALALVGDLAELGTSQGDVCASDPDGRRDRRRELLAETLGGAIGVWRGLWIVQDRVSGAAGLGTPMIPRRHAPPPATDPRALRYAPAHGPRRAARGGSSGRPRSSPWAPS